MPSIGDLGRIAAVVASFSLVGLPRVARAAPDELPGVTDEPPEETNETKNDPQLDRAMKAYELGQAAYNAADYEQALGHFQEAASLYGSPDFQYNIGLCYEKLDKAEEAIRAFETYLRAKPDANDRAQVEDRIERLRERMEKGEASPKTTEPGKDEATPAKSTDGRALVISGAVLLGVGAALGLAGGIGFGVAAKRRSDDLDDVQSGGNPNDVTFGGAQDLEKEGKRFEVLQITMAAIGAAVGITGVALLAVGLSKRKKAASAARVRVVPSFARGTGGLVLDGRF